ncbi:MULTISPECIES: proline--tRNA ligase [Paenibacillus]|uniref:proline--tRNA ligase n=1 Tax=Paenibacillus TaxID=44249 RepID=UPI00048FE6F6|nr:MULTISPECIES: proline--tRNA ligase [Paenibacillus]MEC2345339.1 proline--tRNA ligase [Paenibacillus barengoltzii]
MRQSRLLSPTLREAPSDAEAASHQHLLRAGYIRQLAAGIYSYLPLGRKVLLRIEQIVREEMNRAGAQELLLPAMQPAELWQRSGRYERYGPELIRFKDRHDREFALGPTHEEVITSLLRDEVNSYRQLPLTVYQIQTKFRDERRPRFGLLRGREFLMKDAYSFDTDWTGLDGAYQSMVSAYEKIFRRCGLKFRAVEADPGTIGGEGGTHEFMALADIGEDVVAVCGNCDYAANLEKATSALPDPSLQTQSAAADRPEVVDTPGVHTIEQLGQFFQVGPEHFLKTLIYVPEGKEPVAVVVRGDHEVNELKVAAWLGVDHVQLADHETVEKITGAPVGFAGPIGLMIPVLMDREASNMDTAIAGANAPDTHLRSVCPTRDVAEASIGDFRNVVKGDACPRCKEGRLQLLRGIEVGHVFKLGTKYSERLGAVFLDAQGRQQPMIMGCYGIGLSRLMSAIAEQHHDEHGLIWPVSIAPYQVHIIPISASNSQQMELSLKLYEELTQAGVEVLLDDRDERPGSKFNDADLIGIPYRIIIGKSAAQGQVEWVERASMKRELIPIDEAIRRIHTRQVL